MTRGFGAAALAAMVVVALPASAEAALKIFTCVPEWAEVARQIGGDHVEVVSALTPFDNPDAIQPTPAIVADMAAADLVACTGADFEDWLPAMLERAQNPRVMPGQPGNFVASDYVTMIAEIGSMGEPGSGGHVHGTGGNPHLQTAPENVIKVAAQLARRMIELDPENEAAYSERARAFIAELTAVKKELEELGAPLKGINAVAQHGDSIYLMTWLGINVVATVEPEPGVPPGPAHLAEIIEQVPIQDIKFVVYASYSDPSASRFIAEKAGIPLVMIPFEVGSTPAAVDYPSMYRESVKALLDGLNGERS